MTKRSKSRGKGNRKRFSRKNKKQKGGDVGCPAKDINVSENCIPPSNFVDGTDIMFKGTEEDRKITLEACNDPSSEECKNRYYDALMFAVNGQNNNLEKCKEQGQTVDEMKIYQKVRVQSAMMA